MKKIILFTLCMLTIGCASTSTYKHPEGAAYATLQVNAELINANAGLVVDDVALIKMLDMKNGKQIGLYKLKPNKAGHILKIPPFQDMTLMAWVVFSKFGETGACKLESIFSPNENTSYQLVLTIDAKDESLCSYELKNSSGTVVGSSKSLIQKNNFFLHLI